MSNQFVVTKKVVYKVIDGQGPDRAYMSVVPQKMGGIDLVIGASYRNRCACAFDKRSLKELIDTLTEIHEAMKG